MATASTAVFLVPELVEAILLELPPYSLLLVQRVNKTFRDLIDSSVEMQCKLFSQAPSPLTPHKATRNVINPFLARILQRKFEARSGITKPFWRAGRKTHLWVNLGCGYSEFEIPIDRWSSWRKMLVAYEPITFDLQWDRMNKSYIDFGYIRCKRFPAAKMYHVVNKIAKFIVTRPPLTADEIVQHDRYGDEYNDFMDGISDDGNPSDEGPQDQDPDGEDSNDKSAKSAST